MRDTTVPPGTPCRAPREGEPPMHRLEVLPDGVPFAAGTFDSMGALSRAPFPHRHTFHEIVHVTAGRGAHVVDLARWDLRPPHLCVIAPGQVHHWEDVRGLHGDVVLFTDDFLTGHAEDRDLLRRLSERPWLTPDDGVARVFAEMAEEHRGGGSASVLRALLHVLLVRASRLAGEPVGSPPARAGAVAEEFARLVRTGPPAWSVGACADVVGVTAGHLTESVRAATGRTPSQHLREARIREAKRLLGVTGLTVRQVGNRVGFADPAYFCRFFRRETGATPGGFRRGVPRDSP